MRSCGSSQPREPFRGNDPQVIQAVHGTRSRFPARPLLRNCCPQYLPRLAIHESKPQGVSALLESAHETRALARVVDVGARVAVDDRAGQGAIDQDGELAGGGSNGFGLADADGQPAVESAEGGLAADETHGGDAQHAGGAVGGGLGFAAKPAVAGDPVLGREGEPGGEVVLGGPAAQVGADLGDQLQGAIGGEAIDLREVDAGQVVQHGPDVDVGFIAAPARDPRAGQRRRGRGDGGGQPLEFGVDGPVARAELRLAHVEELEVLLEDKEVFGPVVAGQGRGDLVGRGLAVRVAVLGENVGVALTGDEGAQNRQASLADNVADDARGAASSSRRGLSASAGHRCRRSGRGRRGDARARARRGSARRGGSCRAKARYCGVRGATHSLRRRSCDRGRVLTWAGVDEQDLQPAGFEDVVDRDPVDAGGFHGDGGDPTGDQPIREAVEVGGEGPEELDRGRVPIGGNGHIVLGGAVVDAGDIDLNTFEHRGRATRGPDRGRLCFIETSCILRRASGIREAVWRGILLNGITLAGVSPVTKPRLPGPRYDTGLRVAPVGRSASGPGCSADSRHASPTVRPPRQFLA